MIDKPSIRAFKVFETVALRGPVTLNDLTALLPDISRAAIWRALDGLRAQGWLRMRRGDNAFAVTSRFDTIMAKSVTGPLALDELDHLLPDLPKGLDLTIGTFTETGRFEIIECSSCDGVPAGAVSLLDHDIAFAALMVTEDAQMLRHLARWMDRGATPAQRELIRSGGLKPRLKAARAAGVLWGPGRDILAFGQRGRDGSVVGVEVACRHGAPLATLARFHADLASVMDASPNPASPLTVDHLSAGYRAMGRM